MKLILATLGMGKPLEIVVRSFFEVAQRKLGLESDPRTVVLSFDRFLSYELDMSRVFGGVGTRGKTEQGFNKDGVIRVEIAAMKNLRTVFSTLAHELKHVEQTAKGYLGRGTDGVLWHGQLVHGEESEMSVEAFRTYEALPWEQEARDFENSMAMDIDAVLPILEISR